MCCKYLCLPLKVVHRPESHWMCATCRALVQATLMRSSNSRHACPGASQSRQAWYRGTQSIEPDKHCTGGMRRASTLCASSKMSTAPCQRSMRRPMRSFMSTCRACIIFRFQSPECHAVARRARHQNHAQVMDQCSLQNGNPWPGSCMCFMALRLPSKHANMWLRTRPCCSLCRSARHK